MGPQVIFEIIYSIIIKININRKWFPMAHRIDGRVTFNYNEFTSSGMDFYL